MDAQGRRLQEIGKSAPVQVEAADLSHEVVQLIARIEIIAAIKSYILHPVFLAKMALQIENISRGRFGLNFVNAWNKIEFEKAGIPFGEHDERYAYGAEWISIVSKLIAGERVTHSGRHFSIDGYKLTPKDLYRKRPSIYIGGESEPARELVAREGDTWFINGQPFDDVARLVADVRNRARRGAPLRYGLAAFVIARETDAEAQAEYDRLLMLANNKGDAHALQSSKADPNAVMFKTIAKTASLDTNGGTAAGLVGSYDQVAERIVDFHRAGIELFMLQFQPLRHEMRSFATEVIPRVRTLEAQPADRWRSDVAYGKQGAAAP